MYSLDHLVLSVPKLANKIIDDDKLAYYKDIIFEMSSLLNKNYSIYNSSFTKFGPQFYLLSQCYYRGIHNQKDFLKSKEIIEQHQKQN